MHCVSRILKLVHTVLSLPTMLPSVVVGVQEERVAQVALVVRDTIILPGSKGLFIHSQRLSISLSITLPQMTLLTIGMAHRSMALLAIPTLLPSVPILITVARRGSVLLFISGKFIANIRSPTTLVVALAVRVALVDVALATMVLMLAVLLVLTVQQEELTLVQEAEVALVEQGEHGVLLVLKALLVILVHPVTTLVVQQEQVV
jgi:hypothetical protein